MIYPFYKNNNEDNNENSKKKNPHQHLPERSVLTKISNNKDNKLGLSCAKLSLASAKLHTSLSSDKLKLATQLTVFNFTY